MNERIFGVDGEMSGAEISEGHRLIQIGVAIDTDSNGMMLDRPDLFVSHIGWSDEDLVWSDRAEQVHHIPRDVILNAPPAYEVDEALCEWLLDHGADPSTPSQNIMVGFNVGTFDGPFIAHALPKAKTFFARTVGDLHPLCLMLGDLVTAGQGPVPASQWRRALRREGMNYALDFDNEAREHDAGADAVQALGAWRFTERMLQGVSDDAQAWRGWQQQLRLQN